MALLVVYQLRYLMVKEEQMETCYPRFQLAGFRRLGGNLSGINDAIYQIGFSALCLNCSLTKGELIDANKIE